MAAAASSRDPTTRLAAVASLRALRVVLAAARGVTRAVVEDDLRAPPVPDRDARAGVGIEHVLLGMLHRGTGRAATALHARDLALRDLRAALDDGAPGAANG